MASRHFQTLALPSLLYYVLPTWVSVKRCVGIHPASGEVSWRQASVLIGLSIQHSAKLIIGAQYERN